MHRGSEAVPADDKEEADSAQDNDSTHEATEGAIDFGTTSIEARIVTSLSSFVLYVARRARFTSFFWCIFSREEEKAGS